MHEYEVHFDINGSPRYDFVKAQNALHAARKLRAHWLHTEGRVITVEAVFIAGDYESGPVWSAPEMEY